MSELRECTNCGEQVGFLSSRDWCDGCEEVAAEEAAAVLHNLLMVTCPYYWAHRIPDAMCRNGCWEEPRCHTYAPFEVPNDWPPERQLAVAVNRHIREPFPGGLELE